jgi:hypothetical protein
MLPFFKRMIAWLSPGKSREDYVREAKHIREHLTERQIDKILEDTFPASDPPAWY